MATGMFDKFIVTTPQDTFELSRVYNPGTNSLFVYVNGLLCSPVDNYEEVNPLTIKFVESLQPGDVLIVAPAIITNSINIDFSKVKLVGSDKDSIFKRYDDKLHLYNNQKYELKLSIAGKSSVYTFTSRYTPLYSTVKIIRSDLLDLINAIDDDTINFTIWQNGLLADELASSEIKADAIPFYAKQWVRYKAELDLINAIYLAIAGKSGSVAKKLGELQIEKSVKIPYLTDMMKEIKAKLSPFDKQLTGVGVVGKGFVKAGGTSYPITDRRSF